MVKLLSMDALCVSICAMEVLCDLYIAVWCVLSGGAKVTCGVWCWLWCVGGGRGCVGGCCFSLSFFSLKALICSSNVLVLYCNVFVSANQLSTSLWVLSRTCLSLAVVFCVSCSYCLSKFFFWQAYSTLCWASRSFLNLLNSSLSLLFSSTSVLVMLGVGDSGGSAEACDWGNTWWRFSALPGQWLSSADLWWTNPELRWRGSWLIPTPSSPWFILGSLRVGPTTSSSKGGLLAKLGWWAQWGRYVLGSSCAVGRSPSLAR